MKRIHALIIAVVLAAAAVAGLTAAIRTTHLGAAAHSSVPAAQIAKRNRQLDKIERKLLAEAHRKPQAAARARQAPVLYVRPKPIVHVVHRSGGEHEGEHEGDGGHDD
jgi:hypothetical protein